MKILISVIDKKHTNTHTLENEYICSLSFIPV